MHSVRAGGLLVAAVLSVACATGVASGPEAIARLERERASSPQSEPVLRSLGVAYYKSGNLKDARTALEQAANLIADRVNLSTDVERAACAVINCTFAGGAAASPECMAGAF